MASRPEIKLNKETLGFVTAIFAVAGALLTGYNWLQSGRAENAPVVRQIQQKDLEQDHRLDRTDQDRERAEQDRQHFNANIKELSDKTGDLKEAVVRLTTVLENQPSRKAQLITPIPLPAVPAGLSIEARR